MSESPENTLIIAESLKSLGLTKYEALVYIALLKVSGATATEIHEISGVHAHRSTRSWTAFCRKNL